MAVRKTKYVVIWSDGFHSGIEEELSSKDIEIHPGRSAAAKIKHYFQCYNEDCTNPLQVRKIRSVHKIVTSKQKLL